VEDKVACAAICEDRTEKSRLPNKASIFSAELKAVELSLRIIKTDKRKKFIIFTDSKSVLQALLQSQPQNPKVGRILHKLNKITSRKEVVFCWLPSHVGISGNETADKAAKLALEEDVIHDTLPSSDFRVHVHSFSNKRWQTHWDAQINNKLHEIKSNLGQSRARFRCRREEIVFTRLRLGHSHFTHQYLLKGEEPPVCIPCQERLTVKHLLLDCIDFSHVRPQFYRDIHDLKTLFDKVPSDKILGFVKAIGLYNKL
jgi:ribonuclease HI